MEVIQDFNFGIEEENKLRRLEAEWCSKNGVNYEDFVVGKKEEAESPTVVIDYVGYRGARRYFFQANWTKEVNGEWQRLRHEEFPSS